MGNIEDIYVLAGVEGVVHPWGFDRDGDVRGGNGEGGRVHLVVLIISDGRRSDAR
jgi:hypothetical protein